MSDDDKIKANAAADAFEKIFNFRPVVDLDTNNKEPKNNSRFTLQFDVSNADKFNEIIDEMEKQNKDVSIDGIRYNNNPNKLYIYTDTLTPADLEAFKQFKDDLIQLMPKAKEAHIVAGKEAIIGDAVSQTFRQNMKNDYRENLEEMLKTFDTQTTAIFKEAGGLAKGEFKPRDGEKKFEDPTPEEKKFKAVTGELKTKILERAGLDKDKILERAGLDKDDERVVYARTTSVGTFTGEGKDRVFGRIITTEYVVSIDTNGLKGISPTPYAVINETELVAIKDEKRIPVSKTSVVVANDKTIEGNKSIEVEGRAYDGPEKFKETIKLVIEDKGKSLETTTTKTEKTGETERESTIRGRYNEKMIQERYQQGVDFLKKLKSSKQDTAPSTQVANVDQDNAPNPNQSWQAEAAKMANTVENKEFTLADFKNAVAFIDNNALFAKPGVNPQVASTERTGPASTPQVTVPDQGTRTV